MALCKVFPISNEQDLFTKVSKKKEEIIHKRFDNFSLINKIEYIECEGNHQIVMPYSTDENLIYGNIDIKVLINRYKLPYAIVALSGNGLLSVGSGVDKYIKIFILDYIKDHLKSKYNLNITFLDVDYDNSYFSSKFWGNNIKSKSGYNSDNKLYIKLSCSNLNELLMERKELESNYSNGIIRSIAGKMEDIEYIENNKRYQVNFKFDRKGIIKFDFFDIKFFNIVVKKLIDKGFWGVGVYDQ